MLPFYLSLRYNISPFMRIFPTMLDAAYSSRRTCFVGFGKLLVGFEPTP